KIAARSLFTTRSISGDLQKVHKRIQQHTPGPVDFQLAERAGESLRSVFAVSAVQAIELNRQTGTAPAYTASAVPTGALQAVPGAVGRVAFGRFSSPNYRNAERIIAPTPSLLGMPRQLGSHELVVVVFLPSGEMPAGGWPVTLFGHGLTDSMYGSPWAVA